VDKASRTVVFSIDVVSDTYAQLVAGKMSPEIGNILSF
jgi:hypothetical protein